MWRRADRWSAGASLRPAGALTLLAAVLVAIGVLRPPSVVPRLWTGPDWYLTWSVGEHALPAAAGDLDRGWLAAGQIPGEGTRFESMGREALLDLHRLTTPQGAVSAGAAARWKHVWPRDAAFVAVALSATGHRDGALAVLTWLSREQASDGGFAARYRRDGSGVPDDRARQDDGPGWFLWALAEVAPTAPAVDSGLRLAASRSLDRLLRLTEEGRRLPPPTPDYWEVPQSEVSLGLAAPILAGLRAGPRVFRVLGDPARVARAERAAARFALVVERTFAPSYQRFGSWGGRDAALTFLLPPFGPVSPHVLAALSGYEQGARRPAGGLAPGTAWRNHDEAWTPETALVAWSHAVRGDRLAAQEWLDWLDGIRTSWGALPEKVLPDGSPAGPAPLAWTAALVVLTLAELDPVTVPGPVRR